jgi:CBS domain-containing protein
MEVAEIMSRHVLTVPPDARVELAAGFMLDQHIGGLPVCGPDGRLVGIVTESDLLRRAETGTERHRPRWLEFVLGPGKLAEEYAHSHARRVEEVMTRDVATAGPRDSLEHVVGLMERKRIHRVPVLDGDRLVGIVTRADLMRALLSAGREMAPGPASDEQIRVRMWDELERQPWATPGMLHVLVRDGVVTLSGGVPDPRQIDALRVMAQNIPGVREVKDDLAWVDYLSGVVVDMSDVPGKPPSAPHPR